MKKSCLINISPGSSSSASKVWAKRIRVEKSRILKTRKGLIARLPKYLCREDFCMIAIFHPQDPFQQKKKSKKFFSLCHSVKV